jgi:hypothetical protein
MTVEGHTDARTSALFTRHFRCIAKNGFGDGMNAYMHAIT